MLFHVYDDPKPEGYFINEPEGFYRTMLDADWVMYILLPGLLIAIVVALMYAWRLHEIPKHKAQHKKMRQAELVSALTILGLFEHWVWAVALFIAYMDWEAVEDWVLNIVRRSRDVSIMSPTGIVEAAAPTVELEPPFDVGLVSDAAVIETTSVSTLRSEEARS
ncbi:hypothetical protein NVV94_24300 [Pseudomonas sp. LS1212]|uniref:hypothetical protein n=1 Tax=Pseudomonas sp. LS1212 TaxID=2972478 RepID=UPI00215C5397|nr:hypothetical protein [Pseudomonas sp. LS1212]UVJ43624.1 hypothetical protein NVV94_24300 [Pseudomonas sp. LS1212]